MMVCPAYAPAQLEVRVVYHWFVCFCLVILFVKVVVVLISRLYVIVLLLVVIANHVLIATLHV